MFADRMVAAIERKGNPCVVGLDPRVESMPDFITGKLQVSSDQSEIGDAIRSFHERVIGLVADTVPAVKLQIAFYEQYGLSGMRAFVDTIEIARSAGLLVIVDAKRNDIDSTAQAYANAFLGGTSIFGRRIPAFAVDCITVSPFLGRDSIEPFVHACAEHGKGIFVLVKTSNPGSSDVQDQPMQAGGTTSTHLAGLVDDLGKTLVGQSGYSSIGAVVGATFPSEAETLRRLMPAAIILVPGYGAQGGTAEGAAVNFNTDGQGAVVNASRSITYAFGGLDLSQTEFDERVRGNVSQMVTSVTETASARRTQA
jgi:orotidine-5'-phosphate decarboxylase